MKRLKRIRYELEGIDGAPEALEVEVFEPIPLPGGSGHYCYVRIPALLDSEKRIAGVDPRNAIEVVNTFLGVFLERSGYRILAREELPD